MAHTKVDEVVSALVQEILSRRCGNGRSLASEWLLVQRFGCSRLTIREACERLAGAGLVHKQAGEKLWIISERYWPLELLANELIARRDSTHAVALVDDLIDFQRRNLVTIAQLAAERRTDADLYALDLGLYELERAAEWADDHLIARHENELLEALIDSAASRSLTLCGNTGWRLIARLGVRRPPGLPFSPLESWRRLVETIRSGQASPAGAIATTMFEVLFARIRRAYLRQLEPLPPAATELDQGSSTEAEHWLGPDGGASPRAARGSIDGAFAEWIDPAEALWGEHQGPNGADDAPAESAAPTDP